MYSWTLNTGVPKQHKREFPHTFCALTEVNTGSFVFTQSGTIHLHDCFAHCACKNRPVTFGAVAPLILIFFSSTPPFPNKNSIQYVPVCVCQPTDIRCGYITFKRTVGIIYLFISREKAAPLVGLTSIILVNHRLIRQF